MNSYVIILSCSICFTGQDKKSFRQYHMQFFGDIAERGWVTESATMLFEGKEAFDKLVEDIMKNAPNKSVRAKLSQKYEISVRRRTAWEVAVSSATSALPMSRAERKQTYTFDYEDLQKEETEKDKKKKVAQGGKNISPNGLVKGKRKHQSSPEETPVGQPKTKKMKKSLHSEANRDASSPKKSAKVKAQEQFLVFIQKHKEQMATEHPDYTDDMIRECLQQQWEGMNDKQRSRYKCKFVPNSSDSELPVTPIKEKTSGGNVVFNYLLKSFSSINIPIVVYCLCTSTVVCIF